MGIICDIITVLILTGSVYAGYKQGIVNVGFKLFSIIVSILIILFLYSPITDYIVNNTEFDEKIEEFIMEKGIVKSENNNQDDSMNTVIQKYAKDMAQGTQNAVIEASAKPIAVKIISICVMILLYIVINLLLLIIKSFTDFVTKLPILKQCNEIAGLAYGVIRGLLIIYVILAILFFVVSMNGLEEINKAIEQSYVTKFFYENNLLMMLW